MAMTTTPRSITISIQHSQSTGLFKQQVSVNDDLQQVVTSWAATQGVDLCDMDIVVEQEKLAGGSTPRKLGMQDGSTIVVQHCTCFVISRLRKVLSILMTAAHKKSGQVWKHAERHRSELEAAFEEFNLMLDRCEDGAATAARKRRCVRALISDGTLFTSLPCLLHLLLTDDSSAAPAAANRTATATTITNSHAASLAGLTSNQLAGRTSNQLDALCILLQGLRCALQPCQELQASQIREAPKGEEDPELVLVCEALYAADICVSLTAALKLLDAADLPPAQLHRAVHHQWQLISAEAAGIAVTLLQSTHDAAAPRLMPLYSRELFTGACRACVVMACESRATERAPDVPERWWAIAPMLIDAVDRIIYEVYVASASQRRTSSTTAWLQGMPTAWILRLFTTTLRHFGTKAGQKALREHEHDAPSEEESAICGQLRGMEQWLLLAQHGHLGDAAARIAPSGNDVAGLASFGRVAKSEDALCMLSWILVSIMARLPLCEYHVAVPAVATFAAGVLSRRRPPSLISMSKQGLGHSSAGVTSQLPIAEVDVLLNRLGLDTDVAQAYNNAEWEPCTIGAVPGGTVPGGTVPGETVPGATVPQGACGDGPSSTAGDADDGTASGSSVGSNTVASDGVTCAIRSVLNCGSNATATASVDKHAPWAHAVGNAILLMTNPVAAMLWRPLNGNSDDATPPAAVHAVRLQSYVWCQEGGFARCEAVLRASSSELGMLLYGAAHDLLEAILGAAALLVEDDRACSSALTSAMSVTASLRKLWHMLEEEDGLPGLLVVSRDHDALRSQLVRSVRKAVSVLDGGGDDGGCRGAEQLRQLAGRPGAAIAVRCIALQLLPRMVQFASVDLFMQGSIVPIVVDKWLNHVHTVAGCCLQLHKVGMADVTASAGAPLLLTEALRSVRSSNDLQPAVKDRLRSEIASKVTELLTSARGDKGWRLADGLWAETGAVVDFVAAARQWGADTFVRLRLDHVEKAEGGESLGLAASMWDSCLLSILSAGRRSSGGVKPLFGCCHQGCVNLSGDTEAALPMQKCGACHLARYCSKECQQAAWRDGHKAACRAWNEQQRAAAHADAADGS